MLADRLRAAAGSGGGPLLPPLTDLELWVRSDVGITKDGSNFVSSWADQSGNGRDLTEATNKPLWVDSLVNGYPALRFDGANDLLSHITEFLTALPNHIFLILNQVSWTSTDQIFAGTRAGIWVRQQGASPTMMVFNSGSGAGNGVSPSIGSFELINTLFPSGAAAKMALNDGAYSTGDATGSGETMGGIRIGSNSAGTGVFSNIEAAEILAYSAEKVGAELAELQTYVNARYGLW